ncbi:hypothetical protein GQ457_12G008520 [Hibiscus cannabinus]
MGVGQQIGGGWGGGSVGNNRWLVGRLRRRRLVGRLRLREGGRAREGDGEREIRFRDLTNHLVKLFENRLFSIVNLRLVPWGNAALQTDGTFDCQHGPDECLLNAIEACTISMYPNEEQHFRFILCVERLVSGNKLNEWVSCFNTTGLASVPIDCYKSGYGNVLENQYAAETALLNPQHKFVPWVLVNGQPLQEDFKNFVTYVCNGIQGQTSAPGLSLTSTNEQFIEKGNFRLSANLVAIPPLRILVFINVGEFGFAAVVGTFQLIWTMWF